MKSNIALPLTVCICASFVASMPTPGRNFYDGYDGYVQGYDGQQYNSPRHDSTTGVSVGEQFPSYGREVGDSILSAVNDHYPGPTTYPVSNEPMHYEQFENPRVSDGE
ncbi:hypothetical protein CBS101457_003220 [Exobasidium rhododendri]|nr:hypothetical protein CBS101457_003220 [Exobasidium rhododendri]